ncbi:MAG: membrane protein insertion efficiency factor YidD [Vibrio sp.]
MLVHASVWFIHLYRLIAPQRLRGACRFDPTCSEYAILSLNKHGLLKGWRLAFNRIGRCKQPNGGIDYP